MNSTEKLFMVRIYVRQAFLVSMHSNLAKKKFSNPICTAVLSPAVCHDLCHHCLNVSDSLNQKYNCSGPLTFKS